MVEGGSDLSGRQIALDNLARMMPMLTKTQQDFVINEIFAPLLIADENSGQINDVNGSEDGTLEDADLDKRAASDYEMEFQLKIGRQGHLDVKSINREQRDYRHAKEQERLKEERLNNAQVRVFKRLEASWEKIDFTTSPHKLKVELMKFLYVFNNNIGREHHLIAEARERLNEVKKNLNKS